MDLLPPNNNASSKRGRSRKRRRVNTQRSCGEESKQVRNQLLPSELLRDSFLCLDRSSLESAQLVSRGFVSTVQSMDDVCLRGISRVTFSKSQRIFRVEFLQDPGTEEVRFSTRKRSRAEAIFFYGLRHSTGLNCLTLNRITVGESFAGLLQGKIFEFADPAQAQVHLEDVQLAEGVTPVEFFNAFPSFSVLVSRGSKPFIQPQFSNDALLKCFAEKGVWEHWVRYCSDGALTEEGLLDFCLGDYPPNQHYRHLHVENASLSTTFLQKLVDAYTASPKSYAFELLVARVPELDMTDLEGSRQLEHQMSVFAFTQFPDFTIYYLPGSHIRCVRL